MDDVRDPIGEQESTVITTELIDLAEEDITSKRRNSSDQDRSESKGSRKDKTNRRELSEEKKTNSFVRDIIGFLLHLAAVVAALWVVFTFIFGVSIAHGEAMYPRLRDGDVLFYYRLQHDIRVGDVLSVKVGGENQVGRVVAVSGETVDISSEGQLLVDGNIVSEEIFYPTHLVSGSEITYPHEVPEDSYFLLSDFRTNGFDSRNYGTVSRSNVNGKIITVLRRRGI